MMVWLSISLYRSKGEQRDFQAFLRALLAASAPIAPAAAQKRAGQALIEFALIMPLVLLLAVNAVNFGGYIFAWITVAGAARDGADYMMMSSASSRFPHARDCSPGQGTGCKRRGVADE